MCVCVFSTSGHTTKPFWPDVENTHKHKTVKILSKNIHRLFCYLKVI